jgi:hypothetical protein
MAPQPQIYIAKSNLMNLAGPMSILNITRWWASLLAIRIQVG